MSNNGAIQVTDADSLERAVAELLRDSECAASVSCKTRMLRLSEHQGATAQCGRR